MRSGYLLTTHHTDYRVHHLKRTIFICIENCTFNMVSIVKRCGNQTTLVVRASNSRNAGPPPPSGPRDYKVALVTGANTGIGFVTAKELTQQGYYVVMACRNKVREMQVRWRIRFSSSFSSPSTPTQEKFHLKKKLSGTKT